MRTTRPDRDRVRLEAERSFLLRSIDDLEREHLAGDVDDDDYETLRADYVARVADTQRALGVTQHEGSGPELGPTRAPLASRTRRFRRMLGRRRTRRVLGAVALVCLVGAAGLTAADLAHVRLPGQSSSGSVTLSRTAQVAQDLEQASLLANEDEPAEAVALYDSVLAQVPDQPVALAYAGWLVRLSGLKAHDAVAVRRGDESIARAVAVAPSYADARGLDATVLDEDAHDLPAALTQFRAFLADHPDGALLDAFGSRAVSVFRAEHVPVPKVLERFEA